MFDEVFEYGGKGVATLATLGGGCWVVNKLMGNKDSKEEPEEMTYETTRIDRNYRAPHRVLVRKDSVLVDEWGLCVDPAGRVLDPGERTYTIGDLWEWRARGWIPNNSNSGYQQQRYEVEIGNHRFGVAVPRRQPQPQYYEDEYYYEDDYEYERHRRQPRKQRRAPQDTRRRIRTADGPDGPVRVYEYEDEY